MVNYRAMSNDEIEFPWLFIDGSAARQARFLADTEPPIDPDGDTTPLHLPPAPMYDLADDDWPAMEYDGDADYSCACGYLVKNCKIGTFKCRQDNGSEPLDSVDADSADGYTDAYDDGEELP